MIYLPGLPEELLDVGFDRGFGEIACVTCDLAAGVGGLEFLDGGGDAGGGG